MLEKDFFFMKEALLEAEKAYRKNEIPVGALVVKDGAILARAHNIKETSKLPTRHAEIEVIEKTASIIGDWRLTNCEIYVTLEPCLMCAGAIIEARFKRLIFGATEFKTGAFGGSFDIRDLRKNLKLEVTGGILAEESLSLLQEFFEKLRRDG